MAWIGCTAAGALLAVALLHVYWAAGGRALAAGAVPTRHGTPLFRPGRAATLAVAAVLLGAALVAMNGAGVNWPPLSHSWVRPAAAVYGAVFLLRAVGDFRYVGFSKRHRESAFARLDARVYSPFALAIAVVFIVQALVTSA